MPSDITIAAVELSHETNTFSTVGTDRAAFDRAGLRRGSEIRAALRDTATSFAGFFDGAEKHDFLIAPILSVWATPSGLVDGNVLSELLDEVIVGIQATRPDGLLLALHGAMVSDIDEDADAWVLERVRDFVGHRVPIVATLDLHANISQRMVDAADMLVGYDTYPHVDQRERAREACDHMVALIRGRINPTTALVKPPMMPTSQNMLTDRDPMRAILEHARQIEAREGVLNVTVAGGFPPADTSHTGFGVLVTTNNDFEAARAQAQELAREAWERREGFQGGVVTWDDAAAIIREDRHGPVVLVDIGDNPWTGGTGDSAELLRFLLREEIGSAAVASIADPESARRCVEAGPGATLDLRLGGKTDRRHGEPLDVRAYVRVVSDGKYRNLGPMHAGVDVNLGRSAVIVVDGIEALVTTFPETPIDLNVFRSQGIEPLARRVLALKGKGHFRAAFEPISSQIILVEGPGITGADLGRLEFRRVPRPIWPLDADVVWSDAGSAV